ncbi:uncharacterized protein LOC129799718 [Phlebotomus papatasi]|uniref:uncharacterized protein LOC129799718 n=1 Tax=Phlebotomus papatasi TaxID=29031 RepID=UPI002483EFAC|nr:uncharacterized protein LOC129799718 [Phlebotomus papatasi]
MSDSGSSRKRRQIRRSQSLLDKTQSPKPQSPSRDSRAFERQNCSTPVSSQSREESSHLSPYCESSPIFTLCQDLYRKTDVAWKWDSPKQSPLSKRRVEKRVILPKKKEPSQEGRTLRSHSFSKSIRKPPKEEAKTGFYKFKEELLSLGNLVNSDTPSGSPTIEVEEKSGTSKVETTDDMLKFVLEDSDTFCLNGEKTVEVAQNIPEPSAANANPDRDFLFDDSAVDRALCAIDDPSQSEVKSKPNEEIPVIGSGSEKNTARTESEEFYSAVEEEFRSLDEHMKTAKYSQVPKAPPNRDEDLKILIDDSFDEILSQMPLDGPSTSRNTSFGRHNTMPEQKQTQPKVERSAAKGISRYDSMPANPTLKKEEPLSRNASNDSVSSSSSTGKCSMKEIQQKRYEARLRLINFKAQQRNLNRK